MTSTITVDGSAIKTGLGNQGPQGVPGIQGPPGEQGPVGTDVLTNANIDGGQVSVTPAIVYQILSIDGGTP